MKIAILITSDAGENTAKRLQNELDKSVMLFSVMPREGCNRIDSVSAFVEAHFKEFEAFVFIGAMGICVRY